jgi:hypothetical protein
MCCQGLDSSLAISMSTNIDLCTHSPLAIINLPGTVQVVPIRNTKDVTVVLVEADSVQLLSSGGATATLQTTVDDICNKACTARARKTWCQLHRSAFVGSTLANMGCC